MSTFNTLPDAISGNSTDLYISRQGTKAKRQTRDQLAASLSNARWIATENYSVGSETTGSDNKKYVAKQNNGPSYVVVDPVSDTNEVYWSLALDLTEYAKKVEVEDLSNYIVPVGFTMYSTLSTEPTGRWIKGNGAALSRATYADLFAAASASSNYVSQSLKDADPETYAGYYGDGDGSTTFTLPDLRAEIIRGFDDGRGVDAGRGFGSWQIGSYLPGDDGFNNQIISVYRSGNKGQLGWDEFPDSGRILSGTVTSSPATLTPLSPVTSHGGMSRPRNIAYTAWIRY